ncbi:DUF2147 domain-containing protein [Bradyrhizobium sp.]|uniref:DUF2147 domain-containing protein n=1 Tax=Bradyrhizobium sp. TaxID=376 RepID=UPI00391CC71A
MKTMFLAAAAILIAGSAAQGGSSIAFDLDGRKIRVTLPRNCQSLSCLQVSGIDLSGLKSKFDDDDAPASSTAAAAPAAAAPATAAPSTPAPVVNPPVVNAPAPVTAAPVAAAPAPLAPPAAVQMPAAPVTSNAAPPAPAAPVASPAPAATTVAVAPAAGPPAPAAAADPNSPLGLWATEGGKGNVVIEPCGTNICGFAEKTREKILINMKPKDSKWVGRIHDPDGGGNYDSTIALKGPNTLRVQGCAFGGLFCGGQTWKRIS